MRLRKVDYDAARLSHAGAAAETGGWRDLRRHMPLMLAISLISVVACSSTSDAADTVAKILSGAKGVHPASALPKMCINAHARTATASKTIELMQTLGSNCARIDWNWDVLERESGKYDWDGNTLSDPSGPVSFSTYFSAICGRGIQPMLIATYNNPLYSAGVFTAVSGAANIDAFAKFGAALATKAAELKCPSPVVEAFNEPNLTIWTSNVPWSGSDYVPVLSAFSAAVKATRTGATVFSGGISPGPGTMPLPWIKQFMSARETLPSVDAFAVHPYNYHQPPERVQTPLPDQILLDLKALRDAYGAMKPISITEYGFPWKSVGSNLDKQGIYLGWAMLASVVAGVTHFAAYDLVDDGVDYEASGENTFGLFFNGTASSGHPLSGATPYGIKPAGTAFKTVAAAMAGTKTYQIDYEASSGVASIAFEKQGSTSLAIWTTSPGKPRPYTSTIGRFKLVACHDLLGKEVACSYANDKLSVTLSTQVGPIIVSALY